MTVDSSDRAVMIDQHKCPHDAHLKIVKFDLHGPKVTQETYALLDDGSERTMILSSMANKLGLIGESETILLQPVRQDIVYRKGQCVSLTISPGVEDINKNTSFEITDAFTSNNIQLSEYPYQVKSLQQSNPHLHGSPLPPVEQALPTILIGSDHTNLIIPCKPVKFSPMCAPVAVCTKLRWPLQGPAGSLKQLSLTQQCMFISAQEQKPDLLQHVAN